MITPNSLIAPKKVFLAGVFDCFHQGHFNLLWKASKLGILTVGVVKDEAVKRQKGENRPIYNEIFRNQLINNLKMVWDSYLIDDFKFPEDVLEEYHIICLGEDQKHFLNISDIPHDKLVILPRTQGVSTSEIVKKLKEN